MEKNNKVPRAAKATTHIIRSSAELRKSQIRSSRRRIKVLSQFLNKKMRENAPLNIRKAIHDLVGEERKLISSLSSRMLNESNAQRNHKQNL